MFSRNEPFFCYTVWTELKKNSKVNEMRWLLEELQGCNFNKLECYSIKYNLPQYFKRLYVFLDLYGF